MKLSLMMVSLLPILPTSLLQQRDLASLRYPYLRCKLFEVANEALQDGNRKTEYQSDDAVGQTPVKKKPSQAEPPGEVISNYTNATVHLMSAKGST